VAIAFENSLLIDGDFVVNSANVPPKMGPVDLLLRLEQFEARLSPFVETGYGTLAVTQIPYEVTTDPTPRLVWEVPGTLTCQTSSGRNLTVDGFQLTLWSDARFTFKGTMRNVFRHSDWRFRIGVNVWFKSNHLTRPLASAGLGGGWIRNGTAVPILNNQCADSLAALYGKYRQGELFLRFTLSAELTN
jgi:hypothetical protein